jgi:pimeloyl-ACP methyl ester carboxylesterase
LTGEHSPSIEGELSEWLAELLPEVEQVVVPDASHLMHEDNPAFVNDVITGFVDRHPSRQ